MNHSVNASPAAMFSFKNRKNFSALLFRLFFFSTLLIKTGAATAEHLNDLYAPAVRHSVSEGLSQSVVYDIAQDRVGYLWIATGGGLNRFDGYDFKVFRNEPQDNGSLPGNYIKSLLIDHADTLWIGSFGNGLSYYDASSETFHSIPLDGQTDGVEIYALHEDTSHRIWVATASGLYLIHRTDRGDTRGFEASRNLLKKNLNGTITTLHSESDNSVWLGTDRGSLYRVEALGINTIDIAHSYSDLASVSGNKITSIIPHEKKDLLVATKKQGVFTFDTENGLFSPFDIIADEPITNVAKLLRDSEGHLWIATDGQGLFRYSPGNGEIEKLAYHPNDPSSLSSNRLLTLFEDRSRNLWVGTFAKGLNMLSLLPPKIITYRHDTGYPIRLSNELVWSVFKDGDGGLWIGNDSGIDYRPSGETEFHKISTLGQEPWSALIVDATSFLETGNTLWIGTWNRGLIKYDRKLDRATSFTTETHSVGSLNSDTVRVLLHDSKGRLWIGTHLGINVLDLDTGGMRSYIHDPLDHRSIPHNRIRSFCEDHNGRIWIGTSAGLSFYDPSTDGFSRADYPGEWIPRLEKRDIRYIHQDTNGIFWLATGNGLDRVDFENHQLKSYGVKDGLPDNVLYSFLPDNNGYYWISTDNGLSRFDPVSETFTNYFAQDGLQDNEFNFGAYFNDDQNLLYFGGISGISLLNTDKFTFTDGNVSIVINSVDGFDANYTRSRRYLGLNSNNKTITQLEFSRLDKRVVFNFAGLYFQNPYGLRYAYRLVNQDNDWLFTSAKHRNAIYTNLAPGKYKFKLSAANRNNELIGPVLTVPVTIFPAFWQTIWFRLAALGLLVCSILLIIRYRTRKAESAAEFLKAEVKKKTNELQASYRTRDRDLSAISHDLNTPIAIINQMAGKMRNQLSKTGALDTELLDLFSMLKEGVDEANRRINQLSRIVKLRGREKEENAIFDIKPKIEITLTIYHQQRHRLKIGGIPDCKVNCPRETPGIILDNLISNALKYSNRDQSIEVEFFTKKGQYWFKCSDLGQGIPEEERELVQDYYFRRAEHIDGIDGQGIGLAIVRSITSSCGGNLTIEDNKPRGTVVSASIPLYECS